LLTPSSSHHRTGLLSVRDNLRIGLDSLPVEPVRGLSRVVGRNLLSKEVMGRLNLGMGTYSSLLSLVDRVFEPPLLLPFSSSFATTSSVVNAICLRREAWNPSRDCDKKDADPLKNVLRVECSKRALCTFASEVPHDVQGTTAPLDVARLKASSVGTNAVISVFPAMFEREKTIKTKKPQQKQRCAERCDLSRRLEMFRAR